MHWAENSTTCTSASWWSHSCWSSFVANSNASWLHLTEVALPMPSVRNKPIGWTKHAPHHKYFTCLALSSFTYCGCKALLVAYLNIHVDQKPWHKGRLTHSPTRSHWQQCKVLHHLQGWWKSFLENDSLSSKIQLNIDIVPSLSHQFSCMEFNTSIRRS